MQRELIIVCDSREPAGSGWEPFFSVPTVRQKLDTGDYSVPGAEHLVSIERKALDDLIACLCQHRERFTRELERARQIERFRVIVEARYEDILQHRYRSQMSPSSVWASIVALQERYRVPFYFAGNTRTAAKLAEEILLRAYREHRKGVESLVKVPAAILDFRAAQEALLWPRAM